MEALQRSLARYLDLAHRQFDSVQCPRGGQQTISMLRQQAIQYNRDGGNAVVEIGWTP